MTMQRRHFELIAEAMKRSKPPRLGMIADEQHIARAQWETCVSELATQCKLANSNFNRDRFLRACGVEQ